MNQELMTLDFGRIRSYMREKHFLSALLPVMR